jgi:hypothetical protein
MKEQKLNTENAEESSEYTENFMNIAEVTVGGESCYRPHWRVLNAG